MMSTQHKREHAYRVSYQHEVGSSFDPDMEDPVEWERDLQREFLVFSPLLCVHYFSFSDFHNPVAAAETTPLPLLRDPLPPSDFDDEEVSELAALAEDDAYWDALDADDLEFIDSVDSKRSQGRMCPDNGDAMDMS